MKAELGTGAGEPRRARAPAQRSAGKCGARPGAGRMIVRISTEGQYEVAEEDVDRLNELDNAAVSACEAADEAELPDGLRAAAGLCARHRARPVPDDELFGSDIILPPPDVSLAEARTEFQGEGLIPG